MPPAGSFHQDAVGSGLSQQDGCPEVSSSAARSSVPTLSFVERGTLLMLRFILRLDSYYLRRLLVWVEAHRPQDGENIGAVLDFLMTLQGP